MKSLYNSSLLNPQNIPKFGQTLGISHVFTPTQNIDSSSGKPYLQYNVYMREFMQQVLPAPFPKTLVYGYGGLCKKDANSVPVCVQSYPGPTFMVSRGVPVKVTWINQLFKPHMFPIDPTIPWANIRSSDVSYPQGCYPAFPPGAYPAQWPIPTVVHLHGGEVSSDSDGYPNAWSTTVNYTAPQYTFDTYTYPNRQDSSMLWYHDHSLGVTRLNVYAGLAGAYIIKDLNLPYDRPDNCYLPTNEYEIPLIIQDRSFLQDGSLYYPNAGSTPCEHPYWNDDFKGNCIVVNGRVWPNLNVSTQLYRFKILNASNCMIMEYALSNNMEFIQLSTDGGYLTHPRILSSIRLAPGERADILIDFHTIPIGNSIVLLNTYENADVNTIGQVMQFTVSCPSKRTYKIPKTLNSIPTLVPNTPPINQVLYQEEDRIGNVTKFLINGHASNSLPSDYIKVGSTVPYAMINTTKTNIPIHLHLIQFQIQCRIPFQSCVYLKDWLTLNPNPPLNQPTKDIPYEPYIDGPNESPAPYEVGWKDTIQCYPGYITILFARYAPTCYLNEQVQPGFNLFPFDPCVGPGYVWHSQILEHKDNDMSRIQLIVR